VPAHNASVAGGMAGVLSVGPDAQSDRHHSQFPNGKDYYRGLYRCLWHVLEKAGGDDETRTRDLCRDRAAF
jgi:hypothetical protein